MGKISFSDQLPEEDQVIEIMNLNNEKIRCDCHGSSFKVETDFFTCHYCGSPLFLNEHEKELFFWQVVVG